MNLTTEKLKVILDRTELIFGWIRLFYRDMPAYPAYVLLLYFFPQKILRINGRSKWPVHFTSRILFPDNISVGPNSAPGLSPTCYIQGRNGILFGSNVRIGPGVGLISANHDPSDYDQWLPGKPIEIGNNVWIGMHAVITAGVTIGDNVIIGANSVVTKDIPSDSIAAGNPCRVIKPKSPYLGNPPK